ncbi:ABC transporter permease [Terracoccus luteus]|jgi:ABC-2 type transport system permease protein|uniref:ABC-2 type transport system permease protein n=1 Tax=Terracoccus luteus TaxID=53356 RepID=A0A839PMR5_9MICO|nr:polyketide antibiotic transporter [Terracoccus luteus]MBB2985530.1 ABC-2 type transport system permease protein [Terracoccus luteus]MCP2171182.1 ABC-2 type transport system permease protein [Terracoccus luteus]
MTEAAGVGTLVRLGARVDRVLVPVCALGLAVLVAGSARATLALYPGPDGANRALAALGPTLDNPALLSFYGPLSGTGLGALATFKTVLLGAVLLAVLAQVVVRRHTRAEEEAGRLELVAAGRVGRTAPLVAALVLGTATVLMTAALGAAGAAVTGLEPAGSLALGAAWATAGLVWVGLTAVAAQLCTTARATTALSLGALAVAFAARAVGDAVPGASWLTWLSPLGWSEHVAPFGADRWGPLALGVVSWAVLGIMALRLQQGRDLGAGLVTPAPGPATGALRSPLQLTLRLARGPVALWGVAFVLLGLLVAGLASSVGAFVDSPETARLLAELGGSQGSLVDTFYATELGVAAAAAAALGVSLVLRAPAEEASGRAELLLAGTGARSRWLAGQVAVALAAPLLVLTLLGVAAGVVDALRTGDGTAAVARLVAAAVATVPAAWVCVGAAVLVVGAAPRAASAAWAVLVAAVVVGTFGAALGLPDAVVALSPFGHLPHLPGGTAGVVGTLALVAVTAALVAIGLLAARRRDLRTG